MRLEYFQMLDRIEKLSREEFSITVHARVPASSPVFEGHFPGHALMPGVLLLEAMAQASGYLLLALNGFSRMPFFASASEANFRSFVLPDTDLVIEASRIHEGSGYAVTRAQILRDGKRVSDSQLKFRTMPFQTLALERHVRNEGQRLGVLERGSAAP